MDCDGGGFPNRSPRGCRRMPRHRITLPPVLHRDSIPAATLVNRQETASVGDGIRPGSGELVAKEAGRLHSGLTIALLFATPRYFTTTSTTNESGSTFLPGSTFAVTVNNSCVFESNAIVRAWS